MHDEKHISPATGSRTRSSDSVTDTFVFERYNMFITYFKKSESTEETAEEMLNNAEDFRRQYVPPSYRAQDRRDQHNQCVVFPNSPKSFSRRFRSRPTSFYGLRGEVLLLGIEIRLFSVRADRCVCSLRERIVRVVVLSLSLSLSLFILSVFLFLSLSPSIPLALRLFLSFSLSLSL